jgi:hypothetical protein
MQEEFQVYSGKVVKYLNDATIVSRLSHWNVRGPNFYEAHLLFERVYNDLSELMDGLIETLRACGFDPDFNLFAGPGITMDYFDAQSLVELTQDYLMALNGAVGMFYVFCEKNTQDPRLVGIGSRLQAISETVLNDLYLLQAWSGH